MSLAHRLAGLRDLAVARGYVADRFATLGAASFAHELEPLIARATAGDESERRAMIVIASWVAHACARGETARLLAIGVAAAEADLPFVRTLFGEAEASAALVRGARLAEVGIPVFANVSGLPSRRPPEQTVQAWQEERAWCATLPGARLRMARAGADRWLMHHDPVFIERLLDQRWASARDVVQIAARRPTLPAIVLAVATRDRWLRVASVREAIAANPYTPPMLARALARSPAGARGPAGRVPRTLGERRPNHLDDGSQRG